MEEPILTTPCVSTAVDLFNECVATRSIGVMVGANGSGKTYALRALEMRHAKSGMGGVCVRYRCCQVQGSTRGVRDLLLHLGGRLASLRTGATGGLQLFCKLAQAEFKKQDIRVLLLDEADLWDLSSLGGLVTLYDYLLENGRPVTLIMTGALPPPHWLDQISALRSRTLRIETIQPLSKEMLMGVLQEWAPPFLQLANQITNGVAAAEKRLKLIHRGTCGNLRRARQFADLLLMHGQNFKLTEETISWAFTRMMDLPGDGNP